VIPGNLVAAFSGLFLAVLLAPLYAADLYVGMDGSDLNAGTPTEPFATIPYAYSLAVAGDTIIVMPGVYTNYTARWGLRIRASGTASNPIVLRSQIKGQAVIDGQNVSNRNEAIYLDGSYNVIDGFGIRGGPNGGISVYGNFNQIINNEIHHNGNVASTNSNGQDGVYSDKNTHDNLYAANYIHDNGRTGSNLDHGLYLCGDNEIVLNNLLVRNAASGLQIAGYSILRNMKVYNNVAAFNGTSGIILWLALNGVEIKNNIIYRNGHYGIGSWDAHGTGLVVDRNLVFGNGSGNYNFSSGGSDYSYTQGTTISAEPLFVNPDSMDFDPHLRAGSPAINAGLNLSSIFGTDKEGAARSLSGAWDLDAYRYAESEISSSVVFLTKPENNTRIFGSSVTVSANVFENIAIVGVQFKIDGVNLGVEDTTAPYGLSLNTTLIPNGRHLLSAVARDIAGQQFTAAAVEVLVNNSNAAPKISRIANQTLDAGQSTLPLGFTVSDEETTARSLTVSARSSNPNLVSPANIIFGGSGSNRTVVVSPEPNQFGEATIVVSVSDGAATTSTSFILKIKPAITPPFIYLPLEAESAALEAPMGIATDSRASQSQFILSSTHYTGTASFDVNIPLPGAYSIWCRVLSPDNSHDSFYVSVDGGAEDIYDSAEAGRTNAWQWTVVNGRGGTNFMAALMINPRTFLLQAGLHKIAFRARELGTGLDQILLTNDPEYVPNVVFLMAAPPVRIFSIAVDREEFVTLRWPSVPGKSYRLVYKTSLRDAQWIAIGPDQIATDILTSASDNPLGTRYYNVITQPSFP